MGFAKGAVGLGCVFFSVLVWRGAWGWLIWSAIVRCEDWLKVCLSAVFWSYWRGWSSSARSVCCRLEMFHYKVGTKATIRRTSISQRSLMVV